MNSRSLIAAILLIAAFGADARERAVAVPPFAIPLKSSACCLTTGPDGHVWLWTDKGLGRIDDSGAVAYVTYVTGPLPASRFVTGPDGALWLSSGSSSPGTMSSIVRVTTDGVVSRFPVRPDAALQLAAGSDGSIWFTEVNKDRIGKMTLSGEVNEIALDPTFDIPAFIAASPEGSIWFSARRKVGRVTSDGHIDGFSTSDWFAGRAGTSRFNSIAASADGSAWLAIDAEYDTGFSDVPGGAIVRFSPLGSMSVALQRDYAHSLENLIAGPDGALWFTDCNCRRWHLPTWRLVRLTTDGAETDFDIPEAGPLVSQEVISFALDGDQNAWLLMTRSYLAGLPEGLEGFLLKLSVAAK